MRVLFELIAAICAVRDGKGEPTAERTGCSAYRFRLPRALPGPHPVDRGRPAAFLCPSSGELRRMTGGSNRTGDGLFRNVFRVLPGPVRERAGTARAFPSHYLPVGALLAKQVLR